MRHVGIAVDEVYTDGKIPYGHYVPDNMIINGDKNRCVARAYRPRVFSDEIPLCRGVQAFAQMERVFKSNHPSKWKAWRAWRALV